MERRKRSERAKNYCNLVANPFHPEKMHRDLALLIPYQVRSRLPTTSNLHCGDVEKIQELQPERSTMEEISSVSESAKYQL
jgi:hypothetical protein